jgi:hypothetical protein
MKRINLFFLIGFSVLMMTTFNGCREDEPLLESEDKELNSSGDEPYTMTEDESSAPTGGIISSQHNDSPASESVNFLFDNDFYTKFSTFNDAVWILWKGSSSILLSEYSITSASDRPDCDPRNWTLYGSDDEETWVLLDAQTNQSFDNRRQRKIFKLSKVAPYQYYKLDITSNNGSSETHMADWGLAGSKSTNVGTIYSDCDYEGDSILLAEGYYSLEALNAKGINDDDISSLKINEGFQAILYDSDNFEGTSNRVNIDIACLEENDFDNQTSSLVVKPYVPENIDDLMAKASGSSYSSLTPMGNHFESLRGANQADREWFADPDNQPPVPPGLVSSLHLKKFNVTLYPYGDPRPADINQHAIGDCGGIAALAAMAYVVPDYVKSLIIDNGDQTYDISMYDPKGDPVTVVVDSEFLADGNGNLAALSGKNGVATWSTLLEKAVMKWNVRFGANRNIEGIGGEHVTPLFTGNGESFAFNRGVLTPEELARAVKVSLKQGKFILGGFGQVLPIGDVNTVTAHAYTLMQPNSEKSLFAMRNPWGVNPTTSGGFNSRTDGVLNIPLSGEVPATIDLRIISPGAAGTEGMYDPYIPPEDALKSAEAVRITDRLLNSGM